MFGVGLVEMVVLLVLVLGLVGVAGAGVVLVVRLVLQTMTTASSVSAARHERVVPVPVRERWRVALTQVVGLGVGIVVAVTVLGRGSYGTGAMLAPAALGLCVLLAVALGETVVRPARRPGPRTALLTTRRARDHVPPVTTGLVLLVLVLETVTLVLTTASAARDPYTGGMRALTCSTGSTTSTQTPWPGSYYSLPLGLLLLAVVAVAVVALRQVGHRPRGTAHDAPGDAGDAALRRRSARLVVAATGLAVCAPYVGVAVTAGSALLARAVDCGTTGTGGLGTALLVAAAVSAGTALWCVALLLVPAPVVVRQPLAADPAINPAVDAAADTATDVAAPVPDGHRS